MQSGGNPAALPCQTAHSVNNNTHEGLIMPDLFSVAQPLTDVMKKSAARYANYVVTNRAIADIRDGLLPVQRCVLWSAYHIANKSFAKSTRVTGDVMGKYHPHGDSYGTVVKMTAKHVMHPYLEAQGNFGSLIDTPAAARYTEVRMSEYGRMFTSKDYLPLTPFVSNYDGKDKLPVYLPALLPNILLNGTFGIGYGYMARLPAFTQDSVNRLIAKYFRYGKVTDADCDKLVPAFVDKAEFVRTEAFTEFLRTGKGAMSIRPVCSVHHNTINVTGMYAINLDRFSKTLMESPDVRSVTDISEEACIIQVQVNRNPKAVLELISRELSATEPLRANLLINDIGPDYVSDNETLPSELGEYPMPMLVKTWCDYRIDLERKMLTLRRQDANTAIIKNTVLINAAQSLKQLADVLLTKDPEQLRRKVADILHLKELAHADYVLDTSLRRLSGLSVAALDQDVKKLKTEVNALSGKLTNIDAATQAAVEESFGILRG
jgi:DNA gyrase subunit A